MIDNLTLNENFGLFLSAGAVIGFFIGWLVFKWKERQEIRYFRGPYSALGTRNNPSHLQKASESSH